jgi:hypothetical protein
VQFYDSANKQNSMGKWKNCLSAHVTARTALLACGIAAMPQTARASDAREFDPELVIAEEVGKKVFTPKDFEQFAPRNALDMVKQVPGFVIRDESQGRGLGQAADNVLVNGERLASKSDSLTSQIARINADRVVRIEIVDGGTLDIPGLTGQVANIVTRAGGLSGQYEWRMRFRAHYAYPQWLAGEASVSGSTGNLEYTVSLSNDDGRGAAGGETLVSDMTGNLLETRDNVLKLREDNPKLTTTIKWDGPGSSVGNFSAMYHHGYFGLVDRDDRIRPGGLPFERRYTERWRGKEYELNGDFEFALGPGRLKLIALEQYERSRYRETALSTFTDDTPQSGGRYANLTEVSERIARGEYSWKMLGGDFQIAAEAAFNRLDRIARLGELQPDGSFSQDFFRAGSGGVREDRYEVVVTHGRSLASNFTAQLGIGGEYSQLSTTGPNGLVREFWRPKGSLTLAWQPGKRLDLSAKLSRTVGQLNFGDFLGRIYFFIDNENQRNAELVPPQSWEAEVQAKIDLNEWGTTTLRAFAEHTEDLIDLIPRPGGGEARGNLPKMKLYGLEWTGTFKLEPIGFKGARIETEVTLENSSLRDPVTGQTRSLSWHTDRQAEISLRHDIPNSDWAWSIGAEYYHTKPYYRLREVGREWEGPIYTWAFVEHKDVLGATLRLTVFNLNNGRRKIVRNFYDAPRDVGTVIRRERTDQLIGPLFNFSLKGNF